MHFIYQNHNLVPTAFCLFAFLRFLIFLMRRRRPWWPLIEIRSNLEKSWCYNLCRQNNKQRRSEGARFFVFIKYQNKNSEKTRRSPGNEVEQQLVICGKTAKPRKFLTIKYQQGSRQRYQITFFPAEKMKCGHTRAQGCLTISPPMAYYI